MWLRALGALLPVLMGWAVIATANHYVVDLVAGVLLVLVCHAVASRRARPPVYRQRRGAVAADEVAPRRTFASTVTAPSVETRTGLRSSSTISG